MSILVRFAPAGASPEQYDESVRVFEQQGDFPPEGMEYHAAFVDGDEIRVIEIWDSPEHLQAFAERLIPRLAEIGIELPEPEVQEVHNIIRR
jgi:hypothetical protein